MLDIKFHEFDKPTPIQAQAIPIICSGRDVLGCAETGSGKTAAFSIPMIQHCLQQPEIRRGDGPFAIVMAPTRELAQQIEKEAKIFSRSSKGFKTTIVVGGTNMSEQRSDLRQGVEVCVATPAASSTIFTRATPTSVASPSSSSTRRIVCSTWVSNLRFAR